jgi:hypothetical protein
MDLLFHRHELQSIPSLVLFINKPQSVEGMKVLPYHLPSASKKACARPSVCNVPVTG